MIGVGHRFPKARGKGRDFKEIMYRSTLRN